MAAVDLEPIGFEAIEGFDRDDLGEAFAVCHRSATLLVAEAPAQRPALAPAPALVAAARAALESGAETDSRAFFTRWLRPYRLPRPGFVTAYYEAEVEARLSPEPGFEVAVLARPADLVTLNDAPLRGRGGAPLTSARRRADGGLEPYPDRRAIEDDPAFDQRLPLAYVRDRVELFLMQVQGSARLRLADGRALDLTYDGRNGHPYTSIGRRMIERGLMAEDAMSLGALKQTLRDLGQGPGAPGRLLMQENGSYVFFRIDASPQRALGPIGGEGCALTPFRSIAVDRSIWSYGLPFWIAARVPWRGENETKLERLMIAQDTGSAILGPARADLFFGGGAAAGELAGRVRHAADFTVLLPLAAGGAS